MNLETLKMTAVVNALSFFRIPLLAFITPVFEEISDSRVVVKVRLDLRSRNHLGVMYFGALAMGAELSIASKAVQTIQAGDKRIDFIFKDFQADFLKRADGHVHFICDDAAQVAALIRTAGADDERHEGTFTGYACVPSQSQEPVMKYRLTLSVKQRRKKSKNI